MTLVETFFNSEVFWRALPLLLRGLVNTILLGLAATFFGLIFGALICLVRLYAPWAFRILATIYIDVLRAVPTLVVLILIYYALPFLSIRLTSFVSATVALSMVFAAYAAEVFRAGIESIAKGQFEAAAALGLHFPQTLRLVIVPQAVRVVVPPQTSNVVSVFKETALASVVAMPDLLKQATDAQAMMANPTPLIGAALLYLLLLWPLVRLVGWLEKRYRGERAR
jgi:polar amino acid transport system permease protein